MSIAAEEWPWEPGKSPFRMKGLAYRALVQALAADVTGGFDRVLAELPSDALRAFMRQPFLAASWYDTAPIVPVTHVIAELTGTSFSAYARRRARGQAEDDLKGVYRWILGLASPMAVTQALPRIAGRYFDFGRVQVDKQGDREALVVRSGTPSHLAPWYAEISSEFLRVCLPLSGASDASVDVSLTPADERAQGVPTVVIRYRVTWS